VVFVKSVAWFRNNHFRRNKNKDITQPFYRQFCLYFVVITGMMKFFATILKLVLVQAVMLVFQSCMDDTPPEHHNNFHKKETKLDPSNPTTNDVVKLITYDCKYYQLASVSEKWNNIQIKKRFNSQMKWPCVLTYDTLSLGHLKKGKYSVNLIIIDTNPMVTDSISSIETLALEVAQKGNH
jgi:hypothetical protein